MKQRWILEAHLVNMGCEGLLNMTWEMHEEVMMTELLSAPDNRFYGTIRTYSELWTFQHWRDTYKFRTGFLKVAERNEDYLECEFIVLADPKDGYSLIDLRDPEARLVIGFLNPIFHPEKPKRVISKWAATFLGELRKEVTVDRAALMNEQIDRFVKGLWKAKKAGTPLPAYLAHLYTHNELLSTTKQEAYEDLLTVQTYGRPDTNSDSEPDSPPAPAPVPA